MSFHNKTVIVQLGKIILMSFPRRVFSNNDICKQTSLTKLSRDAHFQTYSISYLQINYYSQQRFDLSIVLASYFHYMYIVATTFFVQATKNNSRISVNLATANCGFWERINISWGLVADSFVSVSLSIPLHSDATNSR